MRKLNLLFCVLLSLSFCATLTGCGTDATEATTSTLPLARIGGRIHGGQQPIVGAKVYLYAASTTGYGTIATSLLNSPGYATSDANGSFSLDSLYTLAACQTAHQLVYLVAVGGNPGSGENDDSVLMAALGDCGNLTSNTYTWINEVTTVASVYALQQFMTAGTTDVATSSKNVTGLRNAFLTPSNLASFSDGTALATTPAGNGTVPKNEIYYLANILAACVNTTTGSAQCSSLYSAATPPNGTAPTDTLSAIIDIALNPGNSVSTLYKLPPPQVPFPTILAQPNDWTIGIRYTGGGLSGPRRLAVDASGNTWIADFNSTAISEFNTVGASLHGTTGIVTSVTGHLSVAIEPLFGTVSMAAYPGTSIANFSSNGTPLLSQSWACAPFGIAYDANANLWGGNANANGVCELTNAGIAHNYSLSDTVLTTAIDANGNIWAPTQSGNSTIFEINSSGNLVAGEPTGGWIDSNDNFGLTAAIDAQGDVWTSNGLDPKVVTELSPSGTVLSGAGYPIASFSGSIAIDGADTVWTANQNGSINHLSHTGDPISPSNGYLLSGLSDEVGIALDASGNVWTTDANSYLVELVGAAAPVVTPLARNLLNNPTTLGQRP